METVFTHRKELTTGTQKNNDDFSKMYNRYSPSLFGLIMKWVNNKELAEKLLFQSFIKVWHNRNVYNMYNEDPFLWLCRIAYNSYTDLHGKKGVTKAA